MKRYALSWFPQAAKELDKLDGSQLTQVKKGLTRIEEQGMDAGKPLGKKHNQDLSRCSEIKLRRLGLRIVFKKADDQPSSPQDLLVLEIIDVVAIGSRSDSDVFDDAWHRLI